MGIGMAVLFKVYLFILLILIPLVGQESEDPGLQPESDSRTLEYYESILQKHPDMAEARFGAGYAAYNIEDYSRALSEFESVLSSDDLQLKSKTFYNLGNTLYKAGRFEESLLAYRKALELNPEDAEAKYNYELTRLTMQQLQSPQSQSSTGNQDKEQPEKEEDQKEYSQDQTEAHQQQLQGQESQDQEEKDQQTSNPEQSQENNRKPDVESILNALKADEKNLMKRQLSCAQSKKMEKDW